MAAPATGAVTDTAAPARKLRTGRGYVYVPEDLLVRVLVGRLPDRPAVPGMNRDGGSDVVSTLATLRAERLLVVHDGRSWDLTTQ